jgi:hypothetical protein
VLVLADRSHADAALSVGLMDSRIERLARGLQGPQRPPVDFLQSPLCQPPLGLPELGGLRLIRIFLAPPALHLAANARDAGLRHAEITAHAKLRLIAHPHRVINPQVPLAWLLPPALGGDNELVDQKTEFLRTHGKGSCGAKRRHKKD